MTSPGGERAGSASPPAIARHDSRYTATPKYKRDILVLRGPADTGFSRWGNQPTREHAHKFVPVHFVWQCWAPSADNFLPPTSLLVLPHTHSRVTIRLCNFGRTRVHRIVRHAPPLQWDIAPAEGVFHAACCTRRSCRTARHTLGMEIMPAMATR